MFYLLHADESSTRRGNLKSVSILRVSLTMAKLSSSLVVFCILSLAFLLTSYQNVEAFTGPLPGRERQMRQTSSQVKKSLTFLLSIHRCLFIVHSHLILKIV